ncbi:MAG: hypothetical protein ACYDGR_11430 [Candidatus Dormibacteria bacterium]
MAPSSSVAGVEVRQDRLYRVARDAQGFHVEAHDGPSDHRPLKEVRYNSSAGFRADSTRAALGDIALSILADATGEDLIRRGVEGSRAVRLHRLFLDDVVIPTTRRDTWIIWRADVFRWLDAHFSKRRLDGRL